MRLQTKTVRQGINKAFLKEPVERPEFDNFKNVLSGILDQIDHAVEADEHEEHLKNLLPPFFKALGFGDHKINTSGLSASLKFVRSKITKSSSLRGF